MKNEKEVKVARSGKVLNSVPGVQGGLKSPLVHPSEREEKRIVGYPDAFAVNAKHAVRGIAASMGLKCVWYALGHADIDKNLAYTVAELEAKAYPLSWWKAPLAFTVAKGKAARLGCANEPNTRTR